MASFTSCGFTRELAIWEEKWGREEGRVSEGREGREEGSPLAVLFGKKN
jgi:hypothetical protein